MNISYLPGVTASQKSWRIERLDGGALVNLSTEIAVNEPSDYVFSIFAQDDAGNNASGMIYARVTPTFNATLEDGFADWIGDEKFRQTIPPYERGDYSVFVVNASIYVSRPGAGYAYGTLYKNGEEVTESIWPNDVIFTPFNSTGRYNLTVSFPSAEIYRMKADGPYTIMVTLWNKDKDRLDQRNYTTSAYNNTDFFTSIPPRPEDSGNEKLKN